MSWTWRTFKRLHAPDLTDDKFWSAINVWNTKPHLLIKHLMVAQKQYCNSFTGDFSYIFELLMEQPNCWVNKLERAFKHLDFNDGEDVQIEIWKLFTKNPSEWNDYLRLSIFDKVNNVAVFCDLTPKNNGKEEKYAFGIYFVDNHLELRVAVEEHHYYQNGSALHWLTEIFFPKLFNWAMNDKGAKPGISSLSYVCVEQYRQLYIKLKKKYAKDLINMWTEVTDPKKHVHKDIAIATYLMLLWNDTKPKFVDMGCGNGLLVHILNSEGYRGIGLDVRSRKMWTQYPNSKALKVISVDPSSSKCKFPLADWIIGNHSDELSPWVPVIASRSNYKCKFFLIPCCAFEFNGSRYQRQDSSISQYLDYMKYLENTSKNVFKFKVLIDRLRISSTKRTCIIGLTKNYSSSERLEILQDIENFTKSKFKENVQFVPRVSEERVRNCTKLDKDIVRSIVDCVVSVLIKRADGWKCCVTLTELANEIGVERLKKLKKECGGLQTLLRNHRYIFVVEKGTVGFRKPVKHSCKIRKKHICWFYHNYPDKCPLNEEECCNIH